MMKPLLIKRFAHQCCPVLHFFKQVVAVYKIIFYVGIKVINLSEALAGIFVDSTT